MEYLPSGVTYNQRNYSMQPYRFCGKEEVTLHGFDMYDSQARWQYSLIPRFSSMDPLAEVTCYSTTLTAIGHAKYRHRLYRVGRDNYWQRRNIGSNKVCYTKPIMEGRAKIRR